MTKIHLNILIIISILIIFTPLVTSVDVWDRPLIQTNFSKINLTINISLSNYYNKTEINNILTNYYNKSQIDFIISNITDDDSYLLNSTDQRYNDTLMIQNVNNTLSSKISDKLDKTDQRYNDTLLINSVNSSLWNNFQYYYNNTEINNIFTNYYNKTEVYNKTEIDFIISNITDDDSYLLNSTDQRYNDTALIESNYLNISLKIDSVNASIKQPSGQYLEYNNSNFWINESKLNNTIRNISKIQKYIYTTYINTSLSNVFTITNNSIQYLITEIRVIPNSSNNKYHFEMLEYPSNNYIDKDRMKHTGIWDIEKNYAINSRVSINITQSTIDELFIIEIIYVDNGVES